MTEEGKRLLSISYSNNEKLIEIDNKLRFDIEKRDDLSYYFRSRDAKTVWITTTFNLILVSSVGAIALKMGLNLDKKTTEYLIAALALFWAAFGVIEYNRESHDVGEVRNNIERKYAIDENDKHQIKKIEKEIKKLKKLKSEIINEEKEINEKLKTLSI